MVWEEVWKAQTGLLMIFQSRKRVKIGSRLETNQIRRNRCRSSFSVVIFTGYGTDEKNVSKDINGGTPFQASTLTIIGVEWCSHPGERAFHVPPFSPGADVMDNQVAIIEYANNVRATFHTNCNSAIKERRFYICGTEGTLRADVFTGQLEVKRIGFDTVTEVINSRTFDGHGGGEGVMAEGLSKTILNGPPPLAGIDEGI